MADKNRAQELRDSLLRYRAMERETTDPLATSLLHDIVLEMERQLEQDEQLRASARTLGPVRI
jgi:hypothetical protein